MSSDIVTAWYAMDLNNYISHEDIELLIEERQEKLVTAVDMLNKLQFDCKDIIDIIFNSPREVFDCFCSPRTKKPSLPEFKRWLNKNRGWNKQKINRLFKEIKKHPELLEI